MPDVAGVRLKDDRADHLRARRHVQLRAADHDDVRALARREAARARGEPQRLCAVGRAPRDHIASPQGEPLWHSPLGVHGVVFHAALKGDDQAHLGEHVAGVERYDVAAERRLHAAAYALLHDRVTHAHVELRLGAHRDLCAGLREQVELALVEAVAVHVNLLVVEQPVHVQLAKAARDRGAPRAARVRHDERVHLARRIDLRFRELERQQQAQKQQ